jgi:regulatory protein
MATRERPKTSVKERALRLLTVRSRSRSELQQRLLRAGFEPEEVESALADLERVGLIDDEAFAREVAEYQRRKGMGQRAGMNALRVKGVDRELAERVAAEANPEDEAERALEVAVQRLQKLRGLDPATRQRRLQDFLMRRGYDPETARDACRKALTEEAGD